MLAKILAVVLLVEATLCQENDDSVRRLRFRRPRPKLIDIENPDGDLRGSPVELNLAESAITPSRPQSSGNAALEALIATAQREDKPAGPPQPQVLEIEEVPTQRPLRAQEAEARPIRTRNRGNVNGVNRRPRPQGGERSEDRRRPNGPREDPIATLERYSHKNDDGSFTFGYVAADGSFREETRGVDCITRGKYGYIDPEGVKREYTYTSGLPCTGDEEESEDNLQSLDGDISIDDPVDPKERFRQTVSEQLTEEQIPVAARPRRPVQRRPAQEPTESESPATNQFANFGANRAVVPERRPTPNRVTPRPRPAPQPAAPVQSGSFDFDAELDGFTLNRPAIKFDNAPVANPNSFSSSIAFNQNSGTFQTSLQQNVQGGVALNLQNQAAPAGTTAAPRTTVPVRTTSQTFAPTPATPAPTAATPAPSVQTIPAGTIKLDFQPLNIPNIAAVQTPVALPPATPAPEAPRQSQPAAPATPRPVPAAAPVPVAAPTPAAAPAKAPAAPTQPANTFFVFSPFGQQQPQPAPNARPVQTPLNPNAFQIRPVSGSVPAPQRAPAPAAAPAPAVQRIPQQPAVQRIPQQPAVQRVPAPQPVQSRPAPQPVQPRPAAVPQRIVPSQPQQVQTRPVQSTPQLQFGFQPVSQGQQRPAPFTAFGGGAPRQRPVQQVQQRPVQLGVPPQRPAAAAPQFAQFDSRFQPQARPQPGQQQLRPAQFQPGSRPAAAPQFSVFNPLQAFRGA